MSGGTWQYKSYELAEWGEKVQAFMTAVSESEHIIDWAEAGDTARRNDDGSGAEHDLYELWLKTFNEVYGDD